MEHKRRVVWRIVLLFSIQWLFIMMQPTKKDHKSRLVNFIPSLLISKKCNCVINRPKYYIYSLIIFHARVCAFKLNNQTILICKQITPFSKSVYWKDLAQNNDLLINLTDSELCEYWIVWWGILSKDSSKIHLLVSNFSKSFNLR